jgi:hypothetical protein
MSGAWSSPAGIGRGREAVLVEVHPGTGVVDRQEDILLVIPTVEPHQWEHVAHLLELWHRRGGGSAHQSERTLTAVLKEAEGGRLPGLAVLQGFTADATVLAYGDVEVTLNETGQRSLRGTEGHPLVKVQLGEPVTLVQIRAIGTAPHAVGSAPFHLREGTVPGGGITVRAVGSPAAANEASPAVNSSPPVGSVQATTTHRAATFESVLLTTMSGQMPLRRAALPLEEPASEAAAAADPQVLVDGVECTAGHFNDPSSGYCATCGQTLVSPRGRRFVRGPRPTLGVLVTDNGSVFALDSGYVIGRAPERDDVVLSGRAKALVLRDVGQSVSRVHAQLELDGWRVLVTDRGSSNGTFISHAGAGGPWDRVGADSPALFPPGARLRIGGRQLLFESYREEVADWTVRR